MHTCPHLCATSLAILAGFGPTIRTWQYLSSIQCPRAAACAHNIFFVLNAISVHVWVGLSWSRRSKERLEEWDSNHGCAIGRECDKTNCDPQPIPHLAALSCPCCAAPSAEGSLIASCDDHDEPPSVLFLGHSQNCTVGVCYGANVVAL